jgi:uncharacterized membrane protein
MGMAILILGLVLFLGAHSVRIYAADWRSTLIGRIGAGRFKLMVAVVSLVGFVLLVWGFGRSRGETIAIWNPPLPLRHVAALFTLVAFVLVAAAYVPANHVKAAIGHPMIAGVKAWALGHLLANGRLNDIVLFGTFLVWAVIDFIASRRRDRAAGTVYPAGRFGRDAIVVVAGVVGWIVFAFYLHYPLIGVRPFN